MVQYSSGRQSGGGGGGRCEVEWLASGRALEREAHTCMGLPADLPLSAASSARCSLFFCELQVLLAGAAAACGTRAVSAWWGVGVGYGAAAAAMRDERRGRMEALALALACIATIVGFRV